MMNNKKLIKVIKRFFSWVLIAISGIITVAVVKVWWSMPEITFMQMVQATWWLWLISVFCFVGSWYLTEVE